MNIQQFQSIIRAVLLGAGTLLVKKGVTDSTTWATVVGFLVGLVPLIWSYFYHASPPAAPSGGNSSAGGGAPLMALFLAAGLLFNTGCKSSPQQLAFQAEGTTIVTVDAAMNLWGAYVAANHPGPAVEARVKAAFEKYQAAMAAVCDAGAIYSATGTTNAPASAALNQAVASSGQDLLDLENLLTTLGVKLQ